MLHDSDEKAAELTFDNLSSRGSHISRRSGTSSMYEFFANPRNSEMLLNDPDSREAGMFLSNVGSNNQNRFSVMES